MSEPRALPSEYPPAQHLLRDLRIWTEVSGSSARVGLDVTREMLCGTGCLATGVLGILVDVLGGGAALTASEGSWIATSEMGLSWLRPARFGPIEAASRLLRVGKSSIVLEADVVQDGRSVALGTLAFTRLEVRGEFQRGTQSLTPAARHSFASDDSRLRLPFPQAAGFHVVSKALGRVDLPIVSYVGNSLGAVQGGVVTALAAYAAECAGEVAMSGEVQAKDLEIHFLALGRKGPLRSGARLLRRDRDASVFRVEVSDSGADGRLCAVARVTVGGFLG